MVVDAVLGQKGPRVGNPKVRRARVEDHHLLEGLGFRV